MKVMVFKGVSQYNVLRQATDEVVLGFQDAGCEVKIVDAAMGEVFSIPEMSQYDFIFSTQAILMDEIGIENQKVLLPEVVKVPQIGWIFDDPLIHHYDRCKSARFDWTAILTIDQNALDDIGVMLPETKNVSFLPHGGFPSSYFVQKDIDVLFPCSMFGEKAMEEFGINSDIERLLVEGTLKLLRANMTISPRTALKEIYRLSDIEVTQESMTMGYNVLCYLNYYMEYITKKEMLESLLNEGIKIYAAGNGFEEYKDKYPDLIDWKKGLDIKDVVDLNNRSKVVINPLYPVLEKGYHERIFTAMLNKALCFSPRSDFLESNLGDRIEYVDLHDVSSFAKRVKRALELFDGGRQERLEDNFQWAAENHTWRKRGQTIVEKFRNGELLR